MLSCSKGSRGLFVPLRVIGIFTDTTISPKSRLRQCPDHYTIRAGRNLPDKEFRYLRTVIVTAAVYRGFNSSLLLRLALLLTFRHRAGVRLYTSSLNFAQPCVFVKQLPGPILCALPLSRDPLSRSYRVNLPSSLTVNHSSALVYSTRLRVSVCGTGTCRIKFSGFSWKYDYTHYWIVLRTLHTVRFDSCSGFAWNNQHLHPSTDYSVSPRRCHDSVSTSLPQVVPEY